MVQPLFESRYEGPVGDTQLEKEQQGVFGNIWRHILVVTMSKGGILRYSVGKRQGR